MMTAASLLQGNNCEQCDFRDNCRLLLGYRTVWCRIESVLQNLTNMDFEGTINMKCESYMNHKEMESFIK